MSCLGPNYLPIPPREWYRVQNRCVTDITPINGNTAYQIAMDYKGNILQYKKNSSNLTKQQKYSLIARGLWTNRTTTWATQTQSYTNPNTGYLKRVNTVNITLDGVVTDKPITCPPTIPPTTPPSLPGTNTGGQPSNPPVIPPPPPPQPPGAPSYPPYPPTVPDSVPPPDTVVEDGGQLLCNVIADPCTGKLYKIPSAGDCQPTSASDVPGKIIDLCYNDNLPTYYSKQRLTMNTSGSKWPVNAKFIRAIPP